MFYILIKTIVIIIAKKQNTNNGKMEKNNKILDVFKLVGIGFLSGIINGFFGAGGGLLLVPMITYVTKNDSKKAHATTLVCVMFMCLASSIIYLIKKQLNFKLILVCLIGSLIGSMIGTKLLKNLKNNIIDLVFSLVLVFAGICMIIF